MMTDQDFFEFRTTVCGDAVSYENREDGTTVVTCADGAKVLVQADGSSREMKLTGHEAIEYAEANKLTLCKYNDPTEDAREGLTLDEARKIAREDPSLIYLNA